MAPRKSGAANPAAPEVAVAPAGGEFPKMVYGPKGAQKIVDSPEAQDKLGKAWKESPDEV